MPAGRFRLKATLLVLALLPFLLPLRAAAQEHGYDTAIEDNSFLIEEAFNQEHRVVQHISTLTYQREEGHLEATFTQEWPVGSQTHQLSYTIPYVSLGGGARGVGDVMINYRYQLAGEEAWALVAPRLSVILPTGSSSRGQNAVGLLQWQQIVFVLQ